MTEAGSIIGTAQYLSPEQARGAAVDQRSDLYSVGILLYEMLTGTVPFTGDSPVEIAMKHLSDTPRPPSLERPEIPPDLDMVVLRALAKNPDDRFQTAEEMDAELDRVAQGAGVTAETADAATAVLSGATLSNAPTAIVPPRRPPTATRPSYRYADPPARRRPVWPWLLALLLVVLAGVAGWYAFGKIQDTLSGSGTVSVPYVVSQKEELAVANIGEKGLEVALHREPNETQKAGKVFRQDPAGGVRLDKGSTVAIYVSTGLPKVEVPDVKGKSRDEAVSTLSSLGLEVKVHGRLLGAGAEHGHRPGSRPRGTTVDKGSTVHINVSKGLQPLTVPSVVGQLYDSAPASSRARGSPSRESDVDSSQPKDVVIDQEPESGATLATRRRRSSLYVSKGPKESTIPEVTSQDEDVGDPDARAVGLRGGRPGPGHDRSEPGRDRPLPGPAGHSKAKPGTTSRLPSGGWFRPPDAEAPRRSRHGRPLERARDLARVGALGARGARPGALRGGDGRDRP